METKDKMTEPKQSSSLTQHASDAHIDDIDLLKQIIYWEEERVHH